MSKSRRVHVTGIQSREGFLSSIIIHRLSLGSEWLLVRIWDLGTKKPLSHYLSLSLLRESRRCLSSFIGGSAMFYGSNPLFLKEDHIAEYGLLVDQ